MQKIWAKNLVLEIDNSTILKAILENNFEIFKEYEETAKKQEVKTLFIKKEGLEALKKYMPNFNYISSNSINLCTSSEENQNLKEFNKTVVTICDFYNND